MTRSEEQLRRDAIAIWTAGVDAVRGDRLVRENVHNNGRWLQVCDEVIDLDSVDRIVVVGTGKAGSGMAAGLEQALGASLITSKSVTGWVNVPADCVQPLQSITLHAARPSGENEPTLEGVHGTREILSLVGGLGARDVCFCLISGGGSALLPAPIDGVTLAAKQAVTKHLSSAGANIKQLNTVRKQLSRIKGGGLARACGAGKLIALIISDVLGDPLDIIASGPTVPDPSTPEEALEILQQFDTSRSIVPESVFDRLRSKPQSPHSTASPDGQVTSSCEVKNLVLGNNAVAVDAAGRKAEQLGYSYVMQANSTLEGQADEIGQQHADRAMQMRHGTGPDCLITGGEPVVTLIDEARRGRGGRNQQLVLAALDRLTLQTGESTDRQLKGIVLLSGGTDGEDGPTDAAGALLDSSSMNAARRHKLDIRDHLLRNDAYHFFQPIGGLLKTGPTHTNVCDIRVIVVNRSPEKVAS